MFGPKKSDAHTQCFFTKESTLGLRTQWLNSPPQKVHTDNELGSGYTQLKEILMSIPSTFPPQKVP